MKALEGQRAQSNRYYHSVCLWPGWFRLTAQSYTLLSCYIKKHSVWIFCVLIDILTLQTLLWHYLFYFVVLLRHRTKSKSVMPKLIELNNDDPIRWLPIIICRDDVCHFRAWLVLISVLLVLVRFCSCSGLFLFSFFIYSSKHFLLGSLIFVYLDIFSCLLFVRVLLIKFCTRLKRYFLFASYVFVSVCFRSSCLSLFLILSVLFILSVSILAFFLYI